MNFISSLLKWIGNTLHSISIPGWGWAVLLVLNASLLMYFFNRRKIRAWRRGSYPDRVVWGESVKNSFLNWWWEHPAPLRLRTTIRNWSASDLRKKRARKRRLASLPASSRPVPVRRRVLQLLPFLAFGLGATLLGYELWKAVSTVGEKIPTFHIAWWGWLLIGIFALLILFWLFRKVLRKKKGEHAKEKHDVPHKDDHAKSTHAGHSDSGHHGPGFWELIFAFAVICEVGFLLTKLTDMRPREEYNVRVATADGRDITPAPLATATLEAPPKPFRVHIPKHSEGFSEVVEVPNGYDICEELDPGATGYDTQYRDSRFHKGDENPDHWHTWQVGEKVNSHGFKYRSTDEQSFDGGIWFTKVGTPCPENPPEPYAS